MKRYYDKTTHNMVFIESESTIEWEFLPQEFIDYANNLSDLSYEVSYSEDGMPVVKRLQLDEEGNRYSHYLEDGTPDLDAIEQARIDNDKATQLADAKEYLLATDFKMTVDYYATLTAEEQAELTEKRAEAREYVRVNDVSNS